MSGIAVDAARFLADLETLRQFGAKGTGVARQAFSDADIASRIWLCEQMRKAGLEVFVDPCGNVFGLPPGDAPCMLVGSHSDTQPLGGWLDGAYGVVCGLELARAGLRQGGARIAVVSFEDEEGRFGGLTGSAVWSGATSPGEADSLTSADGVSFGAARRRAREIAAVVTEVPHGRFSGFIEPHIEQGPVLEAAGERLGVVEVINGIRSVTITFEGETNHAGTTPMRLRRDAYQGLASYTARLNEVFGRIAGSDTVWTQGRVEVEPAAPSIVPGKALTSVQLRDTDSSRLDRMLRHACELAEATARDAQLLVDMKPGFCAEPVWMDDTLKRRLADAAESTAAGRWRVMPSGALHDASNISAVLPAAMLFVPSIGGISHNPSENTKHEDLALGLTALAAALA